MNISKLVRHDGREPFWFMTGGERIVSDGHVAVLTDETASLKHRECLDGDWLGELFANSDTRRAAVKRKPFVHLGSYTRDLFAPGSAALCVRIGEAVAALGYVALVEALHPECRWRAPKCPSIPGNCNLIATVGDKPVAALMPLGDR